MTGLSEQALNRMRTQFAQFLPDTAAIQAMSYVPDGAGGWSEVWQTVVGGTIACRLDALFHNNQIDTIAAHEAAVSEYLLTVPYDAPLDVHQRVIINSATYEVRTLLTDHSWRVAKRAYIAKID